MILILHDEFGPYRIASERLDAKVQEILAQAPIGMAPQYRNFAITLARAVLKWDDDEWVARRLAAKAVPPASR